MTNEQRTALLQAMPMLMKYIDTRKFVERMFELNPEIWEEAVGMPKMWVFTDPDSKWASELCDECHDIVPIVHTRRTMSGRVRCAGCILINRLKVAIIADARAHQDGVGGSGG